MKSVILALAAVFLFAGQNVIIERKLSATSPIINMVFYYLTVLVITFPVFLFAMHRGEILPARENFFWIAMAGVLLFFADASFFSAYYFSGGGKLITITTIAAIFPVFASAIDYATGGNLPTIRQFCGWGLAVIAVALVSGK